VNLFFDSSEFGGIYPEAFAVDKKDWCLRLTEFIHHHRYHDERELKNEWEKKCLHMHEVVEISEGSESFTGTFVGIGKNGEALLETANGLESHFNGTLRF
jgi:biotin-(acetyl-CoA carboxylase) ligase